MVDLKHIKMATEEDKKWKIDYWASLFKATTWEELIMLAKQSAIMKEAVSTMYEITADEAIREQCKAREKQEMELSTLKREKEMAIKKLKQAARQNEKLTRQNELQARQNERLTQQNEQHTRQIDLLTQQIYQIAQEINQLRGQEYTVTKEDTGEYGDLFIACK
ncbi:MAG: hypothetical protein K2L18_05590 [Acetatifactor sp.]|nr:hypothetical protein [Acetatifactor sp.]